jgi:hypothetical protein
VGVERISPKITEMVEPPLDGGGEVTIGRGGENMRAAAMTINHHSKAVSQTEL